MKTLGKMIGLLSMLAFLASPLFAAEAGTGKPLSIKEFSALVENRGASFRMIENRYQEDRKGRLVPKSTLEVEHLR